MIARAPGCQFRSGGVEFVALILATVLYLAEQFAMIRIWRRSAASREGALVEACRNRRNSVKEGGDQRSGPCEM
jgi:hypothetical protein